MTQKGRQERMRMRSERWWLLGGNLLTSLSMPLALSPNKYYLQLLSSTGAEQEQSGPEWSVIALEWVRLTTKRENNLGLSSYAVPQSTAACVVAYFRKNELLSGILERNGID